MLEVVSNTEARSNLFLEIVEVIVDGASKIRAITCGKI